MHSLPRKDVNLLHYTKIWGKFKWIRESEANPLAGRRSLGALATTVRKGRSPGWAGDPNQNTWGREGRAGVDEKAVESMSPYTLNLSPLTEGWQLVEHFHPTFCDQNHIFH